MAKLRFEHDGLIGKCQHLYYMRALCERVLYIAPSRKKKAENACDAHKLEEKKRKEKKRAPHEQDHRYRLLVKTKSTAALANL